MKTRQLSLSSPSLARLACSHQSTQCSHSDPTTHPRATQSSPAPALTPPLLLPASPHSSSSASGHVARPKGCLELQPPLRDRPLGSQVPPRRPTAGPLARSHRGGPFTLPPPRSLFRPDPPSPPFRRLRPCSCSTASRTTGAAGATVRPPLPWLVDAATLSTDLTSLGPPSRRNRRLRRPRLPRPVPLPARLLRHVSAHQDRGLQLQVDRVRLQRAPRRGRRGQGRRLRARLGRVRRLAVRQLLPTPRHLPREVRPAAVPPLVCRDRSRLITAPPLSLRARPQRLRPVRPAVPARRPDLLRRRPPAQGAQLWVPDLVQGRRNVGQD